MINVGVAILKNKLSFFLDKVQRGSIVLITDRGKPVARIVPIAEEKESNEEEILASLVKEGVVDYRYTNDSFSNPKPVRLPQNMASSILQSDRDEW